MGSARFHRSRCRERPLWGSWQARQLSSSFQVVAMWDAPWFWPLVRQGGALLAALLAFLLIGRPFIKAMKKRAAARELANSELEAQLLSYSGSGDQAPSVTTQSARTVTLEMIEAAPSYDARANLVRAFVRQDSARAAQVVRQLMQENARGS